ncbi:MAG: 23S rRNA (adenine(2503)-C(2))-methyltransferase RlmN [Flavobacteriales bacterium]|nr:23S rRNA (adenine(2503)-C(2))-methyltransferase RlmN [Flavobacteriales bacterium]|tara:strand:- start:236 stop:1279 length:1044 start_codon:yes stop_codon:yes gene_type:complete
MIVSKPDIREITTKALEDFFIKHNAPKFRASQVKEWLWKHRKINFNEMTNLSIHDRNLLHEHFIINSLKIIKKQISVDGTIKFLFFVNENRFIEGVIIPQFDRLTACISSQVGCSLSCTFCATGKLKLYKNLSSGEIYDQVFLLNEYALKYFNRPISNIVYMGMGEPLLNIKNVLKSIKLITSKNGMGMSGKRITVSTVGITKMIKKIADINPNFNLAISLHSANDIKRSEIMEINKTNNLKKLSQALLYFYEKTKIKPTYEYVLLSGINDSIDDAKELVNFCKKIPSKVNLIEYNQVEDGAYEKSTEEATGLFISFLEKHNILVKLRRSRGEDIAAACGQLAIQNT